jgi:hypothetical protein
MMLPAAMMCPAGHEGKHHSMTTFLAAHHSEEYHYFAGVTASVLC